MRKVAVFIIWAMFGVAPTLKAEEMGFVDFRKDSLTNHTIYFRIGSSLIDPDYQDNTQSLARIDSVLSDAAILSCLDSIGITATSSPDGNFAYNKQLASHRAESLKMYIEQHYPTISPSVIHTHALVESWQLMRPMLTEGTPYRTEIAAVLDLKLPSAATEARLRSIDKGKAWDYILHQYLPLMRSGGTYVLYTHPITSPPKVTELPPQTPAIVAIPVIEQTLAIRLEPTVRPLFAVKTNLLYDALTALNIEVEVPIGPRWSVAGEYIFPWWLSNRKQHCLQSLSGSLEGRYWFGDRTQRRQLTGWFAGIYTGGGYYDLEWDHKGHQGEFYIPIGVSGGYAHLIGRNLSMEYSLGIGYLRTRYRNYTAQNCFDGQLRLVREQTGIYNWVGPTKIKVSLVWLINDKKK